MSNTPKPVRYIVKHYTDPTLTGEPREEVFVTYSAELPASLSYAIHTASRYYGNIYQENPNGSYELVRQYKP